MKVPFKMLSIEKPCNKCGEVKVLDDFIAEKRNKDGKANICKTCYNKKTQLLMKTKRGLLSNIYDRQITLHLNITELNL